MCLTSLWHVVVLTLQHYTGDFLSVFNRDAWQFHRDLVKKYGEVVRLSWILGVWSYIDYTHHSFT